MITWYLFAKQLLIVAFSQVDDLKEVTIRDQIVVTFRPKTALNFVIKNANGGSMFFDGFKYTNHNVNKKSTTYKCSTHRTSGCKCNDKLFMDIGLVHLNNAVYMLA